MTNLLIPYFRRDLTQLSDVTATLEADGSSPQIMMESFGRRRAAPMFRTGGAALVSNHHPPCPSGPFGPATLVVTPVTAVGADQSTLISSAADASNNGSGCGGGAIIEIGDGGDCSVVFPNCSDQDTNSSQDTLNAR